jgi:hypothetical protein
MANALTTVMQIGIVLTAMNRLQEQESIYTEYRLLAFNDDMTIGIKDELYLREYMEAHYQICEELSHKMKRNKSFMGRSFVFCEIYSDEAFNNKSAYIRGFINSILFARNIVQAKQLLSSLDFTYVTRLTKEIDRLISHWGYEFYQDEISAPIAFGGWWSRKMNGVDLTFHECKINDERISAFFAVRKERLVI